LSALLDDGLSRHCRFLRFHGSLGRLSAPRLAQLACADFVRHHAWVVTAHEGSQTLAVAEARFWVAADGRCAEFALSIADAWQAQGLGTRLLQTLAGAACEHGVKRLHGSVLGANTAMFALLRRCGFGCTAAEDASGTVLAERWLGSETSEAEPETRRGRT
jgi:L-amino acid N-acyltransferase YncA